MTEEELISQCRYYCGEEDNPFDQGSPAANSDMAWYWDMEEMYVKMTARGEEFVGERDYYERLNGKKFPGIPYTLLMIMFTSWGKSGYIEENLQSFYDVINDYLFIPNDHIPEDKIPNKKVNMGV